MLQLRPNEQTLVRRMRVVAAGVDPLAASLRVRSAFSSVQMAPAWLAPSAILCVRRLHASRGARWRLEAGALRLTRELDDTLRAEVERLARGAARPARGHVPAGAESVVFSDRAELLVSLAADWCERREGARWWWRSLFGGTPDRGTILRAFADAPEYLPGVFAGLARLGRAQRFAATLGDAPSRALLSSVARKFGLGELDSALASAFAQATRAPESGVDVAALPGSTREAQPPWAEVAPEGCDQNLGTAERCLLGVGLTLARTPALITRASFAPLASAWLRAAHAVSDEESATGSRASVLISPDTTREQQITVASSGRVREVAMMGDQSGGSAAAEGLPAATRAGGRDKSTRAAHDSVGDAEKGSDGESGSPTLPSAKSAPSVTSADVGDVVNMSATRNDADGTDVRQDEHNVVSPPSLATTDQETDARAAWREQEFEAQIETRYGGLFFLVNLALFLELYGDFTAPSAPGLPLPIWDFVALLGRALCGAEVEADPVWSLLARLAGRDPRADRRSAPGEGFEPPAEWRTPVEWLKSFTDGGNWRWSAARGRLRVSHPAGFLVFDVALARDATRAQLTRELRPYLEARPGLRLRRVASRRDGEGCDARGLWLRRLTEYVRARLSRALGAEGPRELSRLLCERRARIFVTAARVDVSMRLAELPVEIRFAGLDRDPGWVPAAGRHVAFHFE
ncbi:MAG: hypothetical protein ACJ741_03055 [Pyrinomonadaceae bacterium]